MTDAGVTGRTVGCAVTFDRRACHPKGRHRFSICAAQLRRSSGGTRMEPNGARPLRCLVRGGQRLRPSSSELVWTRAGRVSLWHRSVGCIRYDIPWRHQYQSLSESGLGLLPDYSRAVAVACHDTSLAAYSPPGFVVGFSTGLTALVLGATVATR
jgi:hypothetical protein